MEPSNPTDLETLTGQAFLASEALNNPQALQAFTDAFDLSAFDAFQRAAVRIEAMLDALDGSNDSAQKRRRRALLVAAAAIMAQSSRSRDSNKPITEDEKATFLVALASGLSHGVACQLVPSVNPTSWYALKRRDAEFAARWDDAMDMSVEPVLSRMADIGLFGAEDHMATIKAAELVLRNRSSRQRADMLGQAVAVGSGRLKVQLHVEMNTGLPD